MPGKVYITGVGPGDYKLITLKAIECISRADVIVYDRLVSDRILGFARKDAELIYVGKIPGLHAVSQEKINGILVEKALEGKVVARVKGGDPFVFGRGGEEAEALRENGIEFEIVPGVTSAVAVPAYAGIPVTHRDFCSSFHVITGHERPDKENSLVDYGELAGLRGTLVFLMGVKSLPEICQSLIDNGKDRGTPAAVIEKGTTSEQRKITGTLEDIAQKAAEAGVRSPAITVIGDVVSLNGKLDWFPRGKLTGKRIIVTRSREQASKLVDKIEELGGMAIEFPTIRIEGPEDFTHFDQVLKRLPGYEWLVFTSENGVKAFFGRMMTNRIDIRSLAGVKLAAIGEATMEALNKYGLNVDYVPEKYTNRELLKGFPPSGGDSPKILLARGNLSDKKLVEGLKAKGYEVEDLIVYRTVLGDGRREDILEMIEEGGIDYITFTSSSTVRNFVSILGQENISKTSGIKVLCIGPVTAKTAEESGLKVTAVADRYTIDGLVEKLVEEVG
ncbi:MAG TPA: uroporphyrinogen-III C-methyltransferase [Clostridiaceae bacterium]|nr:uroporphyrinogen-III C-methyltransferase [Clostridiaceae bacterium]